MSAAWYPAARRRDGPSNKFGYPTRNPTDKYGHKKGACYHSSEGTLASWWGILDNRVPPRKSATFFNPKRGKLYQHYRVDAHTWANGTTAANKGYVSCENEGMAGEPLTTSQVDNLVGLSAWLKERFGWAELSRTTTMREHNEFKATACPSGRIPWAEIIRRAEEDDMPYSFIVQEQDGGEEGVWMVSGDLMSRWRIFGWGHVDQFRYTLEAQGGKAREPQRRDISRPPAGYLASIRNVGAPRQG